jgi:betaine-homocysteine S-methyltransferase
MTAKRGLLERLAQGPVICAEGFLFELERRGYCSAGEFVPEVALENPEALRMLHRDFQRAGSDIVQAFTYNGHREKMRVIGKEDILEPLNRAALRIAKEVADSNPSGEPDLMAGNISNTNIWNPDDPATQDEVRAMFREMCGWAADEGADMLIGETFYYHGEALAALAAMKRHDLPAVVTLGVMADGRMLDGPTPAETCAELERHGADVVGLNCFRGIPTFMPLLRAVRAACSGPVAALPLPYRTTTEHPTFFNLPDDDTCTCPAPHGRTFPTALDPLFMNRYEVRQWAEEANALGVNYLGLCCGNNPMLTREVAEAVGRVTEASRFSERMQHHFMYGSHERLPEHMKAQGARA